jgi:hypothetical protein
MKSLLFAILLLSGFTVIAQQPPNSLYKVGTPGFGLPKYDTIIVQKSLLPLASFSHNTSKGKIYNLPIDNMPCLVPDMRKVAAMPGKIIPEFKQGMPNAFPNQKLIPENDKKDEKR